MERSWFTSPAKNRIDLRILDSLSVSLKKARYFDGRLKGIDVVFLLKRKGHLEFHFKVVFVHQDLIDVAVDEFLALGYVLLGHKPLEYREHLPQVVLRHLDRGVPGPQLLEGCFQGQFLVLQLGYPGLERLLEEPAFYGCDDVFYLPVGLIQPGLQVSYLAADFGAGFRLVFVEHLDQAGDGLFVEQLPLQLVQDVHLHVFPADFLVVALLGPVPVAAAVGDVFRPMEKILATFRKKFLQKARCAEWDSVIATSEAPFDSGQVEYLGYGCANGISLADSCC